MEGKTENQMKLKWKKKQAVALKEGKSKKMWEIKKMCIRKDWKNR